MSDQILAKDERDAMQRVAMALHVEQQARARNQKAAPIPITLEDLETLLAVVRRAACVIAGRSQRATRQ